MKMAMNIKRFGSLVSLIFVIFLFILARSNLSAHTFQTNLYPDIELKSDHLAIELWIASFLFPPFEDIGYGDGKTRPTLDEAGKKVLDFFNSTCPIEINGENVPPIIEWLKFEEMDEVSHLGETADITMAKMLFKYPINEEVRNIKFGWGLWFPENSVKVINEEGQEEVSHNPNILDMLIFVDGEAHPMYLTKEEPEYVWHASAKTYNDTIISDVINGAQTQKVITLPAISILILVIGFLITITRPKGRPLLRLSIIIISFVLAFFSKNILRMETPIALDGSIEKLEPNQAVDQFTKLHRGIYRAFDSETEDAIYNNLAKSVSTQLIGPLYEEIFQSLILREEGGAVSRVNKIDYIDIKATPENNSNSFNVFCKWQVHGSVRHWGHNHFRSNEYEAEYVLSPENNLWKIASSSVSLQKRIKPPNGK